MKDKFERGQLAGDHEKWLCIQLDEAAGSELNGLFQPLSTIVISPKPSYAYDMFHTPDFSQKMETAASYGYDEVWCNNPVLDWARDHPDIEALHRRETMVMLLPLTPVPLRTALSQPLSKNHHGYIATRLSRHTQP